MRNDFTYTLVVAIVTMAAGFVVAVLPHFWAPYMRQTQFPRGLGKGLFMGAALYGNSFCCYYLYVFLVVKIRSQYWTPSIEEVEEVPRESLTDVAQAWQTRSSIYSLLSSISSFSTLGGA
jgi:hypothetical protein